MEDFTALRHRYYKLGKERIEILRAMGFFHTIENQGITQAMEKQAMMRIEGQGLLNELVARIERKEADLERKSGEGTPAQVSR